MNESGVLLEKNKDYYEINLLHAAIKRNNDLRHNNIAEAGFAFTRIRCLGVFILTDGYPVPSRSAKNLTCFSDQHVICSDGESDAQQKSRHTTGTHPRQHSLRTAPQ